MRICRTTAVLLVATFMAGCSSNDHEKAQPSMTTIAREAPWSISYRDGSNNSFRVWQESDEAAARFAYTPTTPETSSSGVYSGGPPRSGSLQDAHVEAFWQWVVKLEGDPSLHAASRMMGTGAFRVTTASGMRRFIVRNGSLLGEFNAFLAQWRD